MIQIYELSRLICFVLLHSHSFLFAVDIVLTE